MKEITNLKLTIVEIKSELKNFGTKLTEHITDQKETDKKVADNFEVIKGKIDGLGNSLQDGLQDKADQKEIVGLLKEEYVTKEAFGPVRAIAYVLVGTMSTIVIGAVIWSVLK